MSDAPPRLVWTDFVYHLAALLRDQEIDTPLYLVGGAVRDACLRRATTDVDIAVDGDAVAIARLAADTLDADVYVLDKEREVARVLVSWQGEQVCIDFARLRGATLEQDLRDRDFTVNAMATNLRGEIDALIDPLGGNADLRKKILRRCSVAAIRSDPIRALRAVRLSVQFQLKIHPDTVPDLRSEASALSQTSGERIRDELFKLLALDRAARGLRVLAHLGLLQQILPRSARAKGDETGDSAPALSHVTVERMSLILKAISSRRTDNTAAAFDLGTLTIQLDRYRASLQAHLAREYGGSRRHEQLLLLAALLSDTQAGDISALKLSAVEERRLHQVAQGRQQFVARDCCSLLDQHRYWYKLMESGIDIILLDLAEYLATQGKYIDQQTWLALVENATNLLHVYFERYDEIVDPPLLLNGNDIQRQLRISPGPLIGDLMSALREAQATGEVRTTSEAKDFVASQREIRES